MFAALSQLDGGAGRAAGAPVSTTQYSACSYAVRHMTRPPLHQGASINDGDLFVFEFTWTLTWCNL